MEIVYNSTNIAHSETEGYIDFACWLWSLRTGVDLEYGGTTSANWPSGSGQVLVRMATVAEWNQFVVPRVGNGSSAATLETTNDSKVIWFNPNKPVDDRYFNLIQHEIGHVLDYEEPGLGTRYHSQNAEDLMHEVVYDANHLTITDAVGVIDNTTLPIANTPDKRSAVLMPDMDIFHPHFNKQNDPIFNFNTAVWLDYDEDSFATTGYHEWEIGRITGANTNGQPSEDDYLDGNIVHLGVILSPDVEYQNVQLEVIGANTLRLIWAEVVS